VAKKKIENFSLPQAKLVKNTGIFCHEKIQEY
jgi:hypothetical protein